MKYIILLLAFFMFASCSHNSYPQDVYPPQDTNYYDNYDHIDVWFDYGYYLGPYGVYMPYYLSPYCHNYYGHSYRYYHGTLAYRNSSTPATHYSPYRPANHAPVYRNYPSSRPSQRSPNYFRPAPQQRQAPQYRPATPMRSPAQFSRPRR